MGDDLLRKGLRAERLPAVQDRLPSLLARTFTEVQHCDQSAVFHRLWFLLDPVVVLLTLMIKLRSFRMLAMIRSCQFHETLQLWSTTSHAHNTKSGPVEIPPTSSPAKPASSSRSTRYQPGGTAAHAGDGELARGGV